MFSSKSMTSVHELLLEIGFCTKLGKMNYLSMQFSVAVPVAVERLGKVGEQSWVLEGQFLHEEVDSGVHLKAVKVVGVSLQPHEEATVRHIGRAERRSRPIQCD